MPAKIVQALLVLICSLIFGYYAYQSLSDYLSYNTVSSQNKERQEDQLMPQICLSSPSLAEERLQKLGITFKEYIKGGIWTSRLSNYSTARVDEIKRMVFPNLTDLLYNVKVRSRIGKDNDKYEESEYNSEEILNGTNVKLVAIDYYYNFAIFCLSFPNSSFPFGIEKVYFDIKQKSEVFVIAPGNFYSFDRKRNFMNILADRNYEYQVYDSFSQRDQRASKTRATLQK